MFSINITTETTTNEGTEFGFILEDYTQRVILAAILAVVFIVGIPGNTLVILAVILSRRLRSPTNWFVVNLAATDFITCAFIPFQMLSLLSQEGWPLPAWICRVAAGMSLTCVTSSTINLALIAFNRWYLLTKSRASFLKMFSRKKMFAFVALAWLYSVVVVVVPTAAGIGTPGHSFKFKTCSYYDNNASTSTALYILFIGIWMFVLPAVSTVIFYILIYKFVKRHAQKMSSHMRMMPNRSDGPSSVVGLSSGSLPSVLESEVGCSSIQNNTMLTPTKQQACCTRSPKGFNREHVTFTKKMALVVCVFFACYLPGICMTTAAVPFDFYLPAVPWSQLLAVINSALNPIIYAWAIPAFSEVMGCILRCRYKNIPNPVDFIRCLSRKWRASIEQVLYIVYNKKGEECHVR